MNRRQQWFDLGSKAFVAARPGAPNIYCCPLCIRGFDTPSPDVMSFEDVPPRSVGGKPLVLTCRACNNRHGSDLDSHLKAGRDLKEILEGTRETGGRLRIGEDRVTVRGTVFGENNTIREVNGKSDPKAREAVKSFFENLAIGSEFHFEFSLKYNEWRERVAWLRVAYLYLFALLGYTFILRKVMNPIREQFFHPDEKQVPQIIKIMTEPIPQDSIISISQPAELRSFSVKLQRWMFFFPGFVDSDSFYDRLAALPEKGSISVKGKPLPFPTEPMFLCDFQPEFAEHLAKGQAGQLNNGV